VNTQATRKVTRNGRQSNVDSQANRILAENAAIRKKHAR
jgi:hypothetical protein